MFNKGDYVVYGHTGICLIEDITHKEEYSVDKDKLFYVLSPKEENYKIYVDTQSTKTILREIISYADALNIVNNTEALQWIDNDKQRERYFKSEFKSCDCKKIAEIIKTLNNRKKEKKLNVSDTRILKQAENYLYKELAYSLNQPVDSIKKYFI